jgi:hypothetical protein
MIFREKLLKVSSFASTSKQWGVISDDQFCLYSDVGMLNIERPEISRSVFVADEHFYVSDIKDAKTFIYSNNHTKIVEYIMSLPFSVEERETAKYIYPIIRHATFGKVVAKFSKESYGLERVFPIDIGLNGVWKVIDDKRFVSRTESEIAINLFENGEIVWNYKFEELLPGYEQKQYGNAVIIEGKIYLYIADVKDVRNAATVAITLDTGKIESRFVDFGGNLVTAGEDIYTANFNIIKAFNFISRKIREWDLREVLATHNLQIHWSTYTIADGKLFFIDGHSITTNRLGVIDLKSMNLIWVEEIMVEDNINGNIQEIRVSGDKLFVHCSDQSLHIFCFE